MFDMGKRICKLRRDAHLSQKQLDEKIGKSASTIGSYENDTAVPTLENAAALAEALHVSLDYLLYGEKSRTLPLQKMSENRVQLLTDLAQEFAAPTSHGAAFSDRKLDILRRLYQESAQNLSATRPAMAICFCVHTRFSVTCAGFVDFGETLWYFGGTAKVPSIGAQMLNISAPKQTRYKLLLKWRNSLTTSRKSFLSFAVACIVALMAATAAFASNSADTDFTFKFSGGLPQRTEWRSKTDDTNVYMSVKGVQHAFTAHVVGADNNYSTTAHDCSHGYTYSISNVGVYRMRNWVHDGSPSYPYAAIYAAPNYGYEFSAWGQWSPDSV